MDGFKSAMRGGALSNLGSRLAQRNSVASLVDDLLFALLCPHTPQLTSFSASSIGGLKGQALDSLNVTREHVTGLVKVAAS